MQQLSAKAWEIMRVIMRGNSDGSWIDLDQLLERLSYKPTKDAVHFSIRALVKRGYIEKKDTDFRREAMRRILAPTTKGLRECRV